MSRQHLYSRIFDDIKGKIVSGEIHAGDYIPPISALRNTFGVSHITVLHALKELAAEGLIAKDPGCGYVAAELPNPNIYVGCLLRSNSVSGRDQYFNEIISGVQNAALTAGVNMVFPYSSAMFPSFPNFQQEIVRTALQMKSLVKGYLLDEWLSDNSISEIVKATGRPVVLVNRPTQLPVHAVCSDDRGGIRKMFQTLRSMKYECFIYADSGWKTPSQLERRAAFSASAADSGMGEDRAKILSSASPGLPDSAYFNELRRRLRDFSGKGRTVIMASADIIAKMILDDLLENGFRIPGDVGVTGFGGVALGQLTPPALTTLKVDTVSLGETAMRLLCSLIRGNLTDSTLKHQQMPTLMFGDTI